MIGAEQAQRDGAPGGTTTEVQLRARPPTVQPAVTAKPVTDDKGGQAKDRAKDDTATTSTTRHHAEPGDDNGGRGEVEPGDDKGGRGEVEPGDDKGKGGDDG